LDAGSSFTLHNTEIVKLKVLLFQRRWEVKKPGFFQWLQNDIFTFLVIQHPSEGSSLLKIEKKGDSLLRSE
jgi:hypothetical protein